MDCVYRPSSCGKSNRFLCLFHGAFLSDSHTHVQSRCRPATPTGIFVWFRGATRRPITSHPLTADDGQVATEIGSRDPSKSRRPSPRRALTRRTGFHAAITVSAEVNQTLRICPQFLFGLIYRVCSKLDMNIVLFLIFPAEGAYHARRGSIPSEITGV